MINEFDESAPFEVKWEQVFGEKLIHCKDCRHWEKIDSSYPFPDFNYCTFWTENKKSLRYTDEDDFCSFASER